MKPSGHQPEISLIVNADDELEAAKLLVGVLGLVQVEVVRSREEVAESCHTIVALQADRQEVSDFEGDVLHLADSSAEYIASKGLYELRRVTTYVPSTLGENDHNPVSRFAHAAFWLDQRLFKASQPLSGSELALWLFVYGIAKQLGHGKWEAWERIYERIGKNRISGRPVSSISQIPSSTVAENFLEVLPPGARREITDFLSTGEVSPDSFNRVCEKLPNSISIMALSVYLWLRGERNFLDQSTRILQGLEWSLPGTSFPRSARLRTSLAYSPVTLLWLYLARYDSGPANESIGERLYLRDVSSLGQLPVIEADTSMPKIPRSAWTLWLRLHRTSSIKGRQVLLTRESYSNAVHELQTYWLQVFKAIQRRRGRLFCRVLPWPDGKRAALTLRFDVDRELTRSQVQTIVEIQTRYLSRPAGSWYFWADDPSAEKWKKILEGNGQEVGIHALRPGDFRPGVGITHHSAPTSAYWQGDSTMASLEQVGALYGEYLGNQLPTPRPVLLPEGKHVQKRSKTLFTGPGFPLEGSTQDKSLDFFDRLSENFRRQLSQGGHAIITTHPDLNMNLIRELLEREDLADVWFCSTRDVVLRMSWLQEYESFSSSTDSGGVKIWSSGPLRNVLTDVELPRLGAQLCRIINVSAGAVYVKP